MSRFAVRSTGGSYWKKDDHDGCPTLFVNPKYLGEVETTNGPKPAVGVDAVVCLGHVELFGRSTEFGVVLVERLTDPDAGPVPIGVVERPGRAWLLTPPSEGEEKDAQAFVDAVIVEGEDGEPVVDRARFDAWKKKHPPLPKPRITPATPKPQPADVDHGDEEAF